MEWKLKKILNFSFFWINHEGGGSLVVYGLFCYSFCSLSLSLSLCLLICHSDNENSLTFINIDLKVNFLVYKHYSQ